MPNPVTRDIHNGTITVDAVDADLLDSHRWYVIAGGHVYRGVRHNGRHGAEYLARVILERKLDRPLQPRECAWVLDNDPSNLTRSNVVSSLTHKRQYVTIPRDQVIPQESYPTTTENPND